MTDAMFVLLTLVPFAGFLWLAAEIADRMEEK